MQYQHIGHKIKGFYRTAKYALRYLDMISKKALYKAKILGFWAKHGLQATLDAFPVKRRTLFLWKRLLINSKGNNEALNELSKRPKTLRKRNWDTEIINKIRCLRSEHPNLSKEKIYPFLLSFCQKKNLTCPKVRTIGRIIADARDKMRKIPVRINSKGKTIICKKINKLRKPKGFKAQYPGHCVSLDTVEIFVHGYRRYVITFIDIYSRFAFAWATNSHTSQTAAKFFLLIKTIFPYQINNVLTDNGAEFMKHFDSLLKDEQKNHWHTYPKTPKMNAHDERFNRTIQEEFLNYHFDDLLDLSSFNDKLFDYLFWYNGERPHFALNLQSPIQFLMIQCRLNQKCNMWWPNTNYKQPQ